MGSEPFSYWVPGTEERQIRIFISHRYEGDSELYDGVIAALKSQGHAIQDMSLTRADRLRGRRGGKRPKTEIQAEVAARIYTSDLLIAPSRPGTSRSDWVTWEVSTAAVGYSVPILFVSQPNTQNMTRLVREISNLSLPHAVAQRDAGDVVRKALQLVDGRPTWDMRQRETDPTKRYRGPPEAALSQVMTRFPFRARLAQNETPKTPTKRRSFFQNLLRRKPNNEEDLGSAP